MLMAFLPACFEIVGYVCFAPMFFGLTLTEAAVMGAVLAAVDIRYTLSAGVSAVAVIFTVLVFRAVGFLICLIRTELNAKERLFCVIAYLPKATVQAAIGSVPLALGLPCGNAVLSVAVLAIIITAPLGAIGIDATCKRLLASGAETKEGYI